MEVKCRKRLFQPDKNQSHSCHKFLYLWTNGHQESTSMRLRAPAEVMSVSPACHHHSSLEAVSGERGRVFDTQPPY